MCAHTQTQTRQTYKLINKSKMTPVKDWTFPFLDLYEVLPFCVMGHTGNRVIKAIVKKSGDGSGPLSILMSVHKRRERESGNGGLKVKIGQLSARQGERPLEKGHLQASLSQTPSHQNCERVTLPAVPASSLWDFFQGSPSRQKQSFQVYKCDSKWLTSCLFISSWLGWQQML